MLNIILSKQLVWVKNSITVDKPEKILDAPDLVDDFYLHQLDWSCNNHLAVSLLDALYIWNAADGSIVELFSKVSYKLFDVLAQVFF